jgi:nucleotide-binding universal stress UspA family protein
MKTKKMKKVLIALDYDPTSQKVAETGFSLAKTMGAEVILMHVMSDPVDYTPMEYSPRLGFIGLKDTGKLQSESIEGLKNESQQFLDKSKHHLGDNSIQTLVKKKDGDCAESILKTAKDLHIDIIVMGSHSRRWLENIVMGSVTEKVLHNTSIPLFIVPTKKHN